MTRDEVEAVFTNNSKLVDDVRKEPSRRNAAIFALGWFGEHCDDYDRMDRNLVIDAAVYYWTNKE